MVSKTLSTALNAILLAGLAALAIVALVTPAKSAVITQTLTTDTLSISISPDFDEISEPSGYFSNQLLTFDRFNTALGTLTGVAISLEGGGIITASATDVVAPPPPPPPPPPCDPLDPFCVDDPPPIPDVDTFNPDDYDPGLIAEAYAVCGATPGTPFALLGEPQQFCILDVVITSSEGGGDGDVEEAEEIGEEISECMEPGSCESEIIVRGGVQAEFIDIEIVPLSLSQEDGMSVQACTNGFIAAPACFENNSGPFVTDLPLPTPIISPLTFFEGPGTFDVLAGVGIPFFTINSTGGDAIFGATAEGTASVTMIFTYESSSQQNTGIPAPGALSLLGMSLIGLSAVRRKNGKMAK